MTYHTNLYSANTIMSKSYFTLFDLPEDFELDLQILEQRYQTLAAQCHPDKFAAKSTFEQKQALMMTTMINDAYRILKHPLDRAAYLLKQQGIDADNPEQTTFPPEFLMQQMQWREEFLESKTINDKATLQQLCQDISSELTSLYHQLTHALQHNQLEIAANTIQQGRFLDKLLKEIQAA